MASLRPRAGQLGLALTLAAFAAALTAKSSICGEIAKEASSTGTAVFVVEFPYDGTGNEPINSISFGSKELVGGVTKSTVFRMNVKMLTAKGGKPQAYVLNTDPPSPKNVGTATLTRKGNETTLRVVGQNDMGETIDLTVACR